MTPATAAALRCPVCGGPLLLAGRSLRCAKAHSFDLAKEGYAYLLPMQKKHTADPGDGKAMVRARRAFLSAGHYAPLMATLAALCAALPHDHIVDAGCGEGSYDKYLYDALGCPQIAAFDLSKEAVRLASKLVPDAAFCVGGSFCAPGARRLGRPAFEHLLAHGRGRVCPYAAPGRASCLRRAHRAASVRPERDFVRLPV